MLPYLPHDLLHTTRDSIHRALLALEVLMRDLFSGPFNKLDALVGVAWGIESARRAGVSEGATSHTYRDTHAHELTVPPSHLPLPLLPHLGQWLYSGITVPLSSLACDTLKESEI